MALTTTKNPAFPLKRTNFSGEDFIQVCGPGGAVYVVDSQGGIQTTGSLTASGGVSSTGTLTASAVNTAILAGSVTSYNGYTVVDQAFQPSVASVHNTAQTATSASTVFYTAAATGLYALTAYCHTTTQGTAGTVTANVVYSDGAAQTLTTTCALQTLGNQGFVNQYTFIPVGSTVAYLTSANTITGTPQWDVHVIVRRFS